MRHFLDLAAMESADLRALLTQAAELKKERSEGRARDTLAGKTLALVFEKPSTRTRVSFEVGMSELGGRALYLSGADLQIGRGESVADTARVLSRYVHAIVLRCHSHDRLAELARHATVPVINGLSARSHPCQILADMLTFEEKRGPIKGRKIAWIGDGNNVCHTFIAGSAHFGYRLAIACPEKFRPAREAIEWANSQGGAVAMADTPEEAAKDASLVATDAWISMGDEGAKERPRLLAPYQVDAGLMRHAAKDALFMHCLPAHRGEEVTADVIDGPQSAVWDEAENRLHVQKAILLWCLERFDGRRLGEV